MSEPFGVGRDRERALDPRPDLAASLGDGAGSRDGLGRDFGGVGQTLWAEGRWVGEQAERIDDSPHALGELLQHIGDRLQRTSLTLAEGYAREDLARHIRVSLKRRGTDSDASQICASFKASHPGRLGTMAREGTAASRGQADPDAMLGEAFRDEDGQSVFVHVGQLPEDPQRVGGRVLNSVVRLRLFNECECAQVDATGDPKVPLSRLTVLFQKAILKEWKGGSAAGSVSLGDDQLVREMVESTSEVLHTVSDQQREARTDRYDLFDVQAESRGWASIFVAPWIQVRLDADDSR